MGKAKSILLLFLCFLFSSLLLNGATHYLVFDQNCMERLEFRYEETQPGNEFIIYSVDLGNGEKVQLEVGLESRAPIKTLNTEVLRSCGDNQELLNAALVEKINNNIDLIYIVAPFNLSGQYRVARVNNASYYKYDGDNIITSTSQYRFEFSMGENKNSGDLSNGDPKGNIFYIDEFPLGPCNVIELRQTYGRDNNYLDIYVVPEIGVVEEKSNQANTSFRLSKINNVLFEDYLYRKCGDFSTKGSDPTSYDQVLNNDFQGNQGNIQVQEQVTHQVQRGETLSAIGRQYEVEVAEIKLWNNLSTDLIYPGDQLLVSPPPVENFSNKGPDDYSFIPDNNNSNSSLDISQPAWTQSTGKHIVQQGETVLSIARMYGYTEERFRYFNDLSPSAIVSQGDVLVTEDCGNAQGNLQSKGVESYNQLPGSLNNQNQYYDYNNSQNAAYRDEFNDFDRNYPSEFQNQQNQQNQNIPEGYNNLDLPPQTTPKSPQINQANDNFYSPGNYGPVPGTYNTSGYLREPAFRRNNQQLQQQQQQQQNPDNYNNNDLLRPQQNRNRTTTPPNTRRSSKTTKPPYGNRPTDFNFPGNGNNELTTKGSQNEQYKSYNAYITGVKKVHTVKEGETLESIAARYGTSVARLRAINEMEKNEIVIPFQQIYVQK